MIVFILTFTLSINIPHRHTGFLHLRCKNLCLQVFTHKQAQVKNPYNLLFQATKLTAVDWDCSAISSQVCRSHSIILISACTIACHLPLGSPHTLSFVLQLLFLVSGSAKSVNENISHIKVVFDPSHSSLTVICLSSGLAETQHVWVN